MRELLSIYYDIHIIEEVIIDGILGYTDNEYVYFTISLDNNKAIYMEQATLAYYLVEIGYSQTAFPVPNLSGEWITNFDNSEYIVVKVSPLQKDHIFSHGELLANFHQQSMTYHYEPQYVSSYGQWKQLWINKLTFFEHYIAEEAEKGSNSFFRLLIDVLPYIIGISENAIQYIQESEYDHRYDESDQGTISFHRYKENLLKPVIWSNDLVYDHLTRDIAEHIRGKLLENDQLENIFIFLRDYEIVQPLSVFSWRLLYARLIFPIHLYDFLAQILETKKFEHQTEALEKFLEMQVNYEKNLKELFNNIKINNKQIQIPFLHWL